MKLLEAPRIAKDAARASKRISPEFFQPITPDALSTILALSGLNVTHFYIEEQDNTKYLHIYCEHQHDVALCPHCKKASDSGYDYKHRSVRHLDTLEMRTIIHFMQRRFDCSVCAKPFTEQLSWIDPKRRQTQAFEEYIFERVKKMPRKLVAVQEGLSESTVLDIFKKKAKESRRHLKSGLLRALGVDEISIKKGHRQYALVLSDLERHCVIAVLPNRLQDCFEEWIDCLTEAERKAIKVVSMDMWNPYRHAVRRKLSHAEIVADRFHVVKQLNHQLDLQRRKLQRDADEELADLLKGSRWILLKTRSELTEKEEEKLRLILAAYPDLRSIYLLREEFRTICNKIQGKDRAERFLRAWIHKARSTGSRYLLKFVKTLFNWWAEFLNYFEDGITQGFVEGTNRAIRVIINRAYGFQKFDNLRLQILVELGET
ncbi:MAG: ISL3 family transposase [bacterium]|nr:ISL3 family transposase [bacterium]